MWIPRLALTLALAVPLAAQEDDAQRAERLVGLLGSRDEARADAAEQELLAIGRPAVNALRAAAKQGAPEVQRRAARIYPFIRWGVHDDCPDAVIAVLNRFEGSDADGRARALRELAQSPDPSAQEALYTAWWDVDDPDLLAELATRTRELRDPWAPKLPLDPDRVEDRLNAVKPEDDARILRARAWARFVRGDFGDACELYARAAATKAGPAVLAPWSASLFRLRRHEEVAQLLANRSTLDGPTTLRRVESLYRAGHREEAESALDAALRTSKGDELRELEQVALACGSAELLAKRAGEKGDVDPEVAAQAWIRLGKLDRAEEAWRQIDHRARRRVLRLLLDARGESSLLTPMFIAEAMESRPAGAARHRRLAQSLESTDPVAALREWRKARLIDPSHPECAQAIERLRAHPADAPGVWLSERPAPPAGLLFATSPVRLGAFYYYMNGEGDLLKVQDPLHPDPNWCYTPPVVREAHSRGFRLRSNCTVSSLGRRGSDLFVLLAHRVTLSDASLADENGEWGCTLCAVNDETGREEWTREFSCVKGVAQLWAEEGVVTVERYGLSVFDLGSRKWRWALPDLGKGALAVVAHGDSLYVGCASGDLCRLRLSDGSVVWRKKWRGDGTNGVSLLATGKRLLYRAAGEKLVALSLDDDSVLWETQPRDVQPCEIFADGERAYLWSIFGTWVTAVSLADGKALWEQSARGHQYGGQTITVTEHALWLGKGAAVLCLRKTSGGVLGWLRAEGGPYSEAAFCPEGDTLCASTARVPLAGENTDRAWREPAAVWTVRLVLGAEGPASVTPKEEDPLAQASLLDDACCGASWRDGAARLALADACLRGKRPGWGVEDVLRAVVISPSCLAQARQLLDRMETEVKRREERPDSGPREDEDEAAYLKRVREDTEEEDRRTECLSRLDSVKRILDQDAQQMEFEEAIREGRAPQEKAGAVLPTYSACHVVSDPSPEVTVRRGLAIARGDYPRTMDSLLSQRLGDVPEPLALAVVGVLVRDGAHAGDCSRLWGLDRYSTCTCDKADIEADLRARLAGGPSALRGAALAALELLGVAMPEEGAETSLRLAFAAEDPRVRLAAAAALARRGNDEGKDALLSALDSKDRDVCWMAMWLAGNLRMAEAVPHISTDAQRGGWYALPILAAIGTDAAWQKVMSVAEGVSPQAAAWDEYYCLAHARSRDALRILARAAEDGKYFRQGDQGFRVLSWMDTPASRLAAMPFARAYLRLDPHGEEALAALARGLSALGDTPSAEAYLARLEADAPPTPARYAVRSQVLAAKGDLAGAREARQSAMEHFDRAEAVAPGSWRRLLDAARLYLDPEAIADPAKARALLERAQAIAPRDPEVLDLLSAARGK